MTALELLNTFYVKSKSNTQLEGVDIPSNDIELFLNNSQELLTQKYYETYFTDRDSSIILNKLLRVQRFDSTNYFQNNTNVENGYYFVLPSDMKYIVMEEVTQSKDGVSHRPRIKEITEKHFNLNDKNPFKKPYENMCWKIIHGVNSTNVSNKSVQIIIPVGYSLDYYYLHYLKNPVSINFASNITSELSETVHYELVETAIELAVKAYKYNLSINEYKQ